MESQWLEFAHDATLQAWGEIKLALGVYAVGLLIELFRPAQRGQPWRNALFNIAYTMFFLLASALLVRSTQWIVQPTVSALGGPLIQWDFGDGPWSEVLYAFTFFLIFDFFYYWFHRLQHSSGILWAQHKFHHSEESLNVTTGNRHHFLESWLRIFLIFIPMGWIIELKVGAVGMVWSVFLLWGYFIHLNLRLPLGPLTPVVAGPQLHRIHHSNLPKHQDKNFAAFFPVYDVLFGSYWGPDRDEYPATGLISGQRMNNARDALFGPFADWWNMLRTRLRQV